MTYVRRGLSLLEKPTFKNKNTKTMKKTILTIAASASIVCTASAAIAVVFEFDTSSNAINGNTVLADAHDTAIDGVTIATPFDLSSLCAGLILTVTPSQDDISYTTTGLGIDTGGTLSAVGDALTFSFNQAITLDFLDIGIFTGTGQVGEDSISLSYSNANPDVNLVGGQFDNNTSDIISFASGNALAAGESFTISRINGDFSLEGFSITVVPEPSSVALLGLGGLALVLRRRK
ncbi:MAG: hypothetical protein ACI9E1_001108 [Cryomorphaceae bacterium]|jgi:hypothetical protein